MKMKDVFELPLEVFNGDCGEWWIVDVNGDEIASQERPDAIVNAVNSHDTLTEQLSVAVKALKTCVDYINNIDAKDEATEALTEIKRLERE